MSQQIGPALAEMLRGQKQLVALNLADTSLEDSGMEAVAEALAEAAPPLQELNLALNSISPAGLPAIARALQGKASTRIHACVKMHFCTRNHDFTHNRAKHAQIRCEGMTKTCTTCMTSGGPPDLPCEPSMLPARSQGSPSCA